jgi:hypothetical protein
VSSFACPRPGWAHHQDSHSGRAKLLRGALRVHRAVLYLDDRRGPLYHRAGDYLRLVAALSRVGAERWWPGADGAEADIMICTPPGDRLRAGWMEAPRLRLTFLGTCGGKGNWCVPDPVLWRVASLASRRPLLMMLSDQEPAGQPPTGRGRHRRQRGGLDCPVRPQRRPPSPRRRQLTAQAVPAWPHSRKPSVAISPGLAQFSERGGAQRNAIAVDYRQLARTAAGHVIPIIPVLRHAKPMRQR